MRLGFVLFLMALVAAAVVIWDYEQAWGEMYDEGDWFWDEWDHKDSL